MRVYLSDGRTQTQYVALNEAQTRVFTEGTIGIQAVYHDGEGRAAGSVILEMGKADALLLAVKLVSEVAIRFPEGG